MKDASSGSRGDAGTVLVSDLDGTLCRTDTLHEALLGLVAERPTALVGLMSSLRNGKAALKSRLAEQYLVPGDALPLNEAVVETLRAARAEGRKTALVSASHQLQVEEVASATGLFDEAWGSDATRNLKGEAKAAFLADRYGVAGFDYIGDAKADIPIWSVARQALTVGAGSSLRHAASQANPVVTHLSPRVAKWRTMLRALRPHQWSKNILVFLPTLAAHDTTSLASVLLGFLAFCFTASAAYIINDLIDLPSDRGHPRKSLRPFASGELDAATGLTMAAGLLFTAIGLAAATGSLAFLAVLVLYLAMTFAYSLVLKRKLLVDVLTLAGLYTIRIVAGAAAASVVLSPWMLGFSIFLFLTLASVKRQAELTDQMKDGRDNLGRAYTVDDLPVLRGMALSAANSTVLVMALYVNSDAVQQLYHRPYLLWLICPLLLYWLLRMVIMTHRGYMTDDPIVFAARDRISLLVVLCSAIVVLAAAVG